MAHLDYEETLKNATAQLILIQSRIGENQKEREVLETELTTVRQIVVSLSSMLGKEFDEDNTLGLTDAVRQAFSTTTDALAPTEVRQRLENLGYDTTKYGNAMAAVHTVINRLVKQKQIVQAPPAAGKPQLYKWAGPGKLADLK